MHYNVLGVIKKGLKSLLLNDFYIESCYLDRLPFKASHNCNNGCIDNNITAGNNPSIEMFARPREVGVHRFFKSLVPGHLHTVLKGIVEYAIDWTMQCILAVTELDCAVYGDAPQI